MFSIFKTLVDIALLRRDPSALPASPAVLAATAVVFVALNLLLLALFRPDGEGGVVQIAASMAFSLFSYWVVLRLFNRPERYLQTMTAIVGFGCLTTPILVPISAWVAPFAQKPDEASPLILVTLPLAIAVVYVTARILRSALECSTVQAVLLVLAQVFLEALVLMSLFAPARAAGG